MKIRITLGLLSLITLMAGCGRSGSAELFDGTHTGNWHTTGSIRVEDGICILQDTAKAVLKQANYQQFELLFEMRTTPGAKGEVWFHTNPQMSKGYAISIDNSTQDSIWWRKSGSLLGVRNLTKSMARDDEWFTLRIRVEQKLVSVWINEQQLVQYLEPDSPYRLEQNERQRLSSGTFVIHSRGSGQIHCRRIVVSTSRGKDEQGVDSLFGVVEEQSDEIIRLHQADFPVLDYHVNLNDQLNAGMAARSSRQTGINYAIAAHCGRGLPISDQQQLEAYLDTMRFQPFLMALQNQDQEWIKGFSSELRAAFDFTMIDALTFTDHKGRLTRLWLPDQTWIDDQQQYMNMIVDRICATLQEPGDLYVNPCFLPSPLNQHYDELWTEERMDRFIDALLASGKALEINEEYRIPNKSIIIRAKAAGIKFAFGSNNSAQPHPLSYSLQMIKECGITPKDMFHPVI